MSTSADAVDKVARKAAEKLAALGEAFLDSIEGPPKVPRIPRQKGSPADAASTKRPAKKVLSPASADESHRKRKQKKKKHKGSVSEPPPLVSPGGKRAASMVKPAAPAEAPPDLSGALAARAPAQPLQVPGRPTAVSERRRFMSDKICQIRSKAQIAEEGRRRKGESEEDAFFKKTLKEVLNFVTPQLGKAERSQFERNKILALGGTLEKSQHHSYAFVQRKRKQLEERRQQKLQEEKILGVSFSSTQHRLAHVGDSLLRKKKKDELQKKRRRNDEILNLGMGAKESRGLAIIPKRSIRAFQRS